MDNLFSYLILHQNQPTSWLIHIQNHSWCWDKPHQNQPTSWLVHIRNHSWCWDKPRATRTHLTHHGLDLGEATTFPHVLFFAFAHGTHLHPNGFLSRDSQGGVSKLFQFGLPGLWELITPSSNLRLGWGLKQTCSSSQELFINMSHFTCTHWGRVDSRLLVVGSQTANLTHGPSFDHNLCCKCSNGSCEVIFDIYTSRAFQWYKKHLKARCFDLCNRALKFWESQRTPSSHFWECKFHPHTCLKVGLWHHQVMVNGKNIGP